MKRDWTPQETNAARSLRDSGLAYAIIGQRMGRTAQGVKRHLQFRDEYPIAVGRGRRPPPTTRREREG